MSKQYVTNSSWNSDEDLLKDTSLTIGDSYPQSETDLLGDNLLDEEALQASNEEGLGAASASYASEFVQPGMSEEGYGEVDYEGGNGTELEGNVVELSSMGDDINEATEGISSVELGKEQTVEHEEQQNGKLSSERTGVISLTPTTNRDKIPDTLKISKEQAAQIQHYTSDKSKVRGRTRGMGRPSVYSRLGIRPVINKQQNPQMLLTQVLRGMIGQQNRMSFSFPGGPPNRGPVPLLNPPFQMRPPNQQRSMSGGPHNLQAVAAGTLKRPFSAGSLNVPISGPQRNPFLRLPPGRFLGPPNQRGQFLYSQPVGCPRIPQLGSQPAQRPLLNQLRPQGFPNPGQFGQQPSLLGQHGLRGPLLTPGSSGSRPLLRNAGANMRFVRPSQPTATNRQGQPVPSLLNQVANVLMSSVNQQMRPGQPSSLMPPNVRGMSPQQRMPMQNLNRFRPPLAQTPRFMGRMPGHGAPAVRSPLIRETQQPLISGFPMTGRQKMFINPRFPNQTAFGTMGFGRPFRMGMPMQQKKAKALLDRAIYTQKKQTAPMKLTGVKRKSTGSEDVPNKFAKSEDVTMSEASTTSDVQTGSTPSASDV